LTNVDEKLANFLRFFSDYDDKITKWYREVLSAVYDNDRAFHDVVDKLAIDTEKLKNDPSYLSTMADIWNNLLKTILFKKKLIAISAANVQFHRDTIATSTRHTERDCSTDNQSSNNSGGR
jgi:hypothetical protein